MYQTKGKEYDFAKRPMVDAGGFLFLKYCPDKRLRCYHIMGRETSGRPHELLALKIGDIIFHNSDGKIYATITIGKEGKTVPRTVPLINSIPYYISEEEVIRHSNAPNASVLQRYVGMRPSNQTRQLCIVLNFVKWDLCGCVRQYQYCRHQRRTQFSLMAGQRATYYLCVTKMLSI
jgi:hypothetical protein